ncbi:MAG: alpha/beta hydrolase [Candidatus Thorarchaeota archaeon]
MTEIVEFSSEGFTLRGVLTKETSSSQKGALILHPHPLYGGDMENPVVLALEDALLKAGYATLRFDFRGASSTLQGYSGIAGAVIDASNALGVLSSYNIQEFGLSGYSFGGSTALCLASECPPLFLITLSASHRIIADGGFNMIGLTKIDCPTLMFHDKSDRMISPSDIDTLSSLIGSESIEKVLLEDESHFYQRSIGEVKERVRLFLTNLDS